MKVHHVYSDSMEPSPRILIWERAECAVRYLHLEFRLPTEYAHACFMAKMVSVMQTEREEWHQHLYFLFLKGIHSDTSISIILIYINLYKYYIYIILFYSKA